MHLTLYLWNIDVYNQNIDYIQYSEWLHTTVAPLYPLMKWQYINSLHSNSAGFFLGRVIIGLTQFTNKAHIARATLEAVCFQTREVRAGTGATCYSVRPCWGGVGRVRYFPCEFFMSSSSHHCQNFNTGQVVRCHFIDVHVAVSMPCCMSEFHLNRACPSSQVDLRSY